MSSVADRARTRKVASPRLDIQTLEKAEVEEWTVEANGGVTLEKLHDLLARLDEQQRIAEESCLRATFVGATSTSHVMSGRSDGIFWAKTELSKLIREVSR